MDYTVYYRCADGAGTKVYLADLTRDSSQRVQQKAFESDPRKTMVWVMDSAGDMLGDPLIR